MKGQSRNNETPEATNKLVYSVNEAAEQLSIGRTMAFHLISSGELGSIKIGSRRLVSRLDLEDFVLKCRGQAA